MRPSARHRRRFLVPEVVQTSALDCGPACLKCLLEGHGIPASYGRLREACQTDLDGTSIDTIEEVAVELGLPAEQVMLPADHLLLPEARALPAMAVVRQPNGLTHFVILWRTLGRFVQVMDPAAGRRWPARRELLSQLYLHRMPVATADWMEWARSEESLAALRARLGQVGVRGRDAARRLDAAAAEPGWRPLASLDAATRMTRSLVAAGGVRDGAEAGRVLDLFHRRSLDEPAAEAIPAAFWSVRPAETPDGEPGDADPEEVLLKGAVLVRVHGDGEPAATGDGTTGRTQRPGPDGDTPVDAAAEPGPTARTATGTADEAAAGARGSRLSPELAAALAEPPSRPGRRLLGLLGRPGAMAAAALAALILVSAGGVVFEALLFRGFFDIGRELTTADQRLGGALALLGFLAVMLLLDLPITHGALRLGRQLEVRLRLAFLRKIPRLGDRYFHSRLSSDMAERCHSVHRLRLLPELGEGAGRALLELLLTTAGIVWLDPGSAPLAALTALVALGLPLAALPMLAERDLRVRNHLGALGRFYLGGLLGLVPLRTHTAERAVRREHESLVVEWARAHLGRERAIVVLDTVLHVGLLLLVAALLFRYVGDRGHGTGVLLLVFWSLNLFALGRMVSLLLAHQYPTYRNVALRLLEPLDAPEEPVPEDDGAAVEAPAAVEVPAAVETPAAVEVPATTAVAVHLRGVAVRVGGHSLLEGIDLEVGAGDHVAIVGPSGAGKSSLVGLLLGWHRAAAGELSIDGRPLDAATLARLRRSTAWVDPEVRLWNRSLLRNLLYGQEDGRPRELGEVIDRAELLEVMEKLPDGLQTLLGEGGGLVSGGEGQRVRLARALLRRHVRLAILDEPFRGLARDQRWRLLGRARQLWSRATLLCITHDVAGTRSFERVLVMDGGRIVEDGSPAELEVRDSRYRRLLEAERQVRSGIWEASGWRRLRLEEGKLVEPTAGGPTAGAPPEGTA